MKILKILILIYISIMFTSFPNKLNAYYPIGYTWIYNEDNLDYIIKFKEKKITI